MKKTNVLSFFASRKAIVSALAFAAAFLFVGMSSAHAQGVPKTTGTPLEQLQAELSWYQEKLNPLPPTHPKVVYYADYVGYLEAVIDDMLNGMSYHAAVRNNDDINPFVHNATGGNNAPDNQFRRASSASNGSNN